MPRKAQANGAGADVAGADVSVKAEPVDYPLVLEQKLKQVFQWQFPDAGPHIATWLRIFHGEEKKAMLIIGEEDDGKPSYSVSANTVTKVQDYLKLIKAPTQIHDESIVDLVSSDEGGDEDGFDSGKTTKRKRSAGGAAAGGAAGGAAAAAILRPVDEKGELAPHTL